MFVKGKIKKAESILHSVAHINKKPVLHFKLKSREKAENKIKTSYIDLFRGCKIAKVTLSQGFIW